MNYRFSVSYAFLSTFASAIVPAARAQPVAIQVGAQIPVPLGLLRLRDAPKPDQAAALVASKFTVDDLAANAAPGVAK